MAQYRQSGADRFAASGRGPHDLHYHSATNGSAPVSATAAAPMSDQMSLRMPHHKPVKIRRLGRADKTRRVPIGTVVLILALTLCVSVFAFNYISSGRQEDGRIEEQDDRIEEQDGDQMNDIDFLSNSTKARESRVLKFGRGSVTMGRDSRDWDKDDRRRDSSFDEDSLDLTDNDHVDSSGAKDYKKLSQGATKERSLISAHVAIDGSAGLYNEAGRDELKQYEAEFEASLKKIGQLGEENGHGSQEEEVASEDGYGDGIDYQDDWLDDLDDVKDDNEDPAAAETRVADVDSEESPGAADTKDSDRDRREALDSAKANDADGDHGESFSDAEIEDADINAEGNSRTGRTNFTNTAEDADEELANNAFENLTSLSQNSDDSEMDTKHSSAAESQSTKKPRSGKKLDARRRRHHRFSGSSCDMKFLESTAQLVEPIESKKFSRFSLQYTEVEEQPDGAENWVPKFAGHQSLREREDSFYAHDQKINCGFVKGPKGFPSTGFDLAEDDMRYMSSCHIAVSSCIFGNSDNLRTPANKVVTRLSRKNVCFVMFMDENTLQMLKSEGNEPDRAGFIGLWKVVIVKNLPYADMRRVGKIPKLLTHRLFPSARYSIWLDSKLRLQKDPLLILEYFLWRKGHEYAISNHYDRHCVWEEVMQNKRLNKYNHSVIDQQFAFYRADGLKKFNASDPKRLLPSCTYVYATHYKEMYCLVWATVIDLMRSVTLGPFTMHLPDWENIICPCEHALVIFCQLDVPEGSFIVRAHTPMSNLFSCLWFNEVERFTPRDQLSFAYTYLKLRRMNPAKPFHLNMFKDCERRSIAKLFHHRPEGKRNIATQAAG
ncbi:hypothetical protein ACLOJK_001078 [Asimina triloba]